jgi:uncharacterized protein (TIGR03000 family)
MRKCFAFGTTLALAAVFALACDAQAQYRGRRGWDGDGYYRGGGYYGFSPYYGRYGYFPSEGRYSAGASPFYRTWFWSTPAIAWDWGSSAAPTEFNYGNVTSDGSMPSNYGSSAAGDCGSYGTIDSYGDYGDMGQAGGQPGYYDNGTNTRNTAAVRVILPNSDAQVWFEGQATQQRGTDRLFISPELQQGQDYEYTVKASWTENGQPVTREKKFKVRAGRGVVADFRSGRTGSSMAGSEPLPNPSMPGREGRYGDLDGNVIQATIVSAGPDQIVITDMDGRNRRTFQVGTTTEVMLNGQKSAINDLKPGMHVTLHPDKNNAQSILRIDEAQEGTGTPRNERLRTPAPGDQQQPNALPPDRSQPAPADQKNALPPEKAQPTSPPDRSPGNTQPSSPEKAQPTSPPDRSPGNTEPLPKPKNPDNNPDSKN